MLIPERVIRFSPEYPEGRFRTFWRKQMRILAAALALTFVTAGSVYAMDALTEEQVEGVQKTIKGMDCTVEDTAIEIEYVEHGGVLHYVLRHLARA